MFVSPYTLFFTPLSKDKIYELPIKDIESNPFQYRTEENLNQSDLKNLAQSISEHGLRSPIQVRRKDGKYILVAGWRRLTAIRLYAKSIKTVKATVDEDMDDQTHKLLTIIENEQREDFTVVEKARAYNDLITNENFKQVEVAKLVGASKTRISQLLKFLILPDDLLKILNNALINGLSNGHAEEIVSGYSKRLDMQDEQSAKMWLIDITEKCFGENLSIENLRDINRLLGDDNSANKKKTTKKKPLKKWVMNGGPWKKFEVSTRNRVVLEFQLPEDYHYNDSKAIIDYIKGDILKNVKEGK